MSTDRLDREREESQSGTTRADSTESGLFRDPRRPGGGTLFSWLRMTARLWGFIAFLVLILFLFRRVILPFVLATLVAYVLAPLIRRLSNVSVRGHKFPRYGSVIVVYVVLLGLIGLFFTSFAPRVTKDFKRIIGEAPAFWQRAREHYVPLVATWMEQNFDAGRSPASVDAQLAADAAAAENANRVRLKPVEGGGYELDLSGLNLRVKAREDDTWVVSVPEGVAQSGHHSQRIAASINSYIQDLVSKSESRTKRLVNVGQRFVHGIFSTITTFILVLMTSAFMLVDAERIVRWFRTLVPEAYYEDFDNVIGLIDRGLSGAIRGQFIICMINATFTWVGLVLIGVKYPLLLALLAGVMSLIPIFGSIMSSIPIVIVALASGTDGVSLFRGVTALLWIIGIHLVEANVLNPKIMGTAAKIHPVIVIFAVVAGEQTFGAMGALLGVPLVSAVQAVFVYLWRKARGTPAAAADLAALDGAPVESGGSGR